jgi:hypothetical protein
VANTGHFGCSVRGSNPLSPVVRFPSEGRTSVRPCRRSGGLRKRSARRSRSRSATPRSSGAWACARRAATTARCASTSSRSGGSPPTTSTRTRLAGVRAQGWRGRWRTSSSPAPRTTAGIPNGGSSRRASSGPSARCAARASSGAAADCPWSSTTSTASMTTIDWRTCGSCARTATRRSTRTADGTTSASTRHNKRKHHDRACPVCETIFRPANGGQQYCSLRCAGHGERGRRAQRARRTVERPPADQLLRDVAASGYLAVGRPLRRERQHDPQVVPGVRARAIAGRGGHRRTRGGGAFTRSII